MINHKDLKILFYDIETPPLKAWVWRPGDQYVNHSMLCKGSNIYNIICISYCWNDGKPAKTLKWDYKTQNCKKMIREFDKIIKQADRTIGKNSDRFDVKHINTQRLLHNLPAMPEWMATTDDLEKQMRRHFALPSQGLDYISEMLGYGGKTKMCMQDWIDIMEQNKNGRKSFKKMCDYCAKDVEDTRAIWNLVAAHIQPRHNFNAGLPLGTRVCKACGSDNIKRNGTFTGGMTKYQRFHCLDHKGYAGKAAINPNTGKLGRIS